MAIVVDPSTVDFVCLVAGLVIGVVLHTLAEDVADLSAASHKIVIIVIAIIGGIATLAASGNIVVPIAAGSVIAGYVIGMGIVINDTVKRTQQLMLEMKK
jgi:small-conductance mechanosensitive channel